MEAIQAQSLASKLDSVSALVSVFVQDDRVVFSGATGQHSVAVSVSSPERVEAHFNGFLGNQPTVVPPKPVSRTQSVQADLRVWKTAPTKANWQAVLEAAGNRPEAPRVGDYFADGNNLFRVTTGLYTPREVWSGGYGHHRQVFRAARYNKSRQGFNKSPHTFGVN